VAAWLPATYFAWQLLQEKKMTSHINNFVSENLSNENMTVLKKIISLDKTPKEVDVYVAGEILSPEQKDTLRKKLVRYHLSDLKLVIHSTPNIEAMQAEPDLFETTHFNPGKKNQ